MTRRASLAAWAGVIRCPAPPLPIPFREASPEAGAALDECGQVLLFAEALQRQPWLCAVGFRTDEHDAQFEALRLCLAYRGGHEFDAAARLLMGAPRRERMAEGRTSNGVRHVLSAVAGREIGAGACIAALVACGVPIRRIRGSAHVEVGLSATWLHELARAGTHKRRVTWDGSPVHQARLRS